MELLAILIALTVITFGGSGFKRQIEKSPACAAVKAAQARYGLPRIIAAGVILEIILYQLVG